MVDIKLLRDTLTSNKSQNVYKADCPTLKIDSTAKSRYLSIHVYKFSISPAVVAKRAGLSYKLFFDNFLFWPRKFGPANFLWSFGRPVGFSVDIRPAEYFVADLWELWLTCFRRIFSHVVKLKTDRSRSA